MDPHRVLQPTRSLGDAPLAQGGQILALAFDPRGDRLAVLGNNHQLSLVDVAAGRITATIPCPSGQRFLAFEDDDRLLACDQRGVVRLTRDGERQLLIECPWGLDEYRVQDVLVRGETIALIESRHHLPYEQFRARLHRGGDPLATIDYSPAQLAGPLALAADERVVLVNAAALTPDGLRLVALASIMRTADGPHGQIAESIRGAVLIHDLGGRLLHAHAFAPGAGGHAGDSQYASDGLALAPDGRRFAVAQGRVWIFDLESGAVVYDDSLRVAGEPIEAQELTWLADGELLAAGERCVGRWSPGASEATHARFYRERAFVLALAASPGAVAVADDCALLLFSLPNLAPMHEAPGHAKSVGLLALDRTGATVASADGSSLIVWDSEARAPRFRLVARSWAGIAFSPDGAELMTPVDGHHPHVLGARSGEIRVVGPSMASAIQWPEQPVCLHYDEVVRDDKVVAEIVLMTGREAREVARMHAPYLRCIPALARDGRRALVWSDMTAYGWDLERREQLWQRPHELVQAALSPDGAFALVTRIAAPPAVLDMATGKIRFELDAAGDTLSWAVAWAPQHHRLAVGKDDGDVCVFELDDPAAKRPRIHCTLLKTGHRPRVASAAFSGDGTAIATGGAEGTIKLFTLPPIEELPGAPRRKWPRGR
jgi:WD40 repeat protein